MAQLKRSPVRPAPPVSARPASQPLLAAVLGVGLLAGCASTPVTEPPTAPTSPSATGGAATPTAPGEERSRPPPGSRPSTDSATLALLQQSERAAESGSLDEALSYVERAVRIEPRRADLWTRLAALELSAGNPTTAIQYAQKALSLAAERPDWQRDAWLVIADAKEALGERSEASAIRQRWRTARG